MNKLQEILNAKPIKPKEWMSQNLPLHLILTNTGPLASNFIYNLLFRIEGMEVGEQPVHVHILDDGSTVRKQDIKLGLYVNKDLGKNRVDVLLGRYGSVFTTPLIKQVDSNQMIKDLKGSHKNNIAILGFGKNFDLSTNLLNVFSKDAEKVSVLNERGGVEKRMSYGRVIRIHAASEEDTLTVVNTVYRNYGDIIGEVDVQEKESTKKGIQNIVIQNQMLSQMMLNCLNLLITDDESMEGLPYLTWNYNMETGKQNNTRNTEPLTIFHKKYIYRTLIESDITKEQLIKLSNDFEEQRKDIEVELKKKEIKHKKAQMTAIITTMTALWNRVLESEIKQAKKKKLFKSEIETIQLKTMVYELLETEKNKQTNKRDHVLAYQLVKYIEDKGWKVTDM